MDIDLETLKSVICWDDTVEKYGEPKNNKSIVIYKCKCGSFFDVTIRQIKIKLKSSKSCRSCSAKVSADKIWSNPESKIKHLDGCLKSYTAERKAKISESSKEKWKDPAYRENQVQIKKNLWKQDQYIANQAAFKTDEFRSAQSERQLKVSSDPEYKKIASLRQKNVWKNLVYKENQSKKQKSVWMLNGYRERASKIQKDVWLRPDHRDKYEIMWKNPEYRHLLSEKIKSIWLSEDFRNRSIIASKRKWEDTEYREKVIQGIKNHWLNPTYRKIRSDQSRLMWKNESYREKSGLARSAQSGKPSSIEIVTSSILDGLSLKYETQKPVGHYLFDFFLPDHDVYIEVQGEYWHSREGVASKDASKFTYLETAKPNSRLLYLFEREFMNPNSIIAKICNFLSNSKIEVSMENFEFKSVDIKQISKEDASKILSSYHYAGLGRSAKLIFGAYLGDELAAVCKLSTAVRAEVATSMDMKPQEILEIDRFCIHPKFQKKNFASWFLSRASRATFSTFPYIKRLVSFSDTTYGHNGGIYIASNWRKIGIVSSDYCYIGSDGFFIHKKTLYNRAVRMSMKEKEYADFHGYEKSFGREKIKFILDRPND